MVSSTAQAGAVTGERDESTEDVRIAAVAEIPPGDFHISAFGLTVSGLPTFEQYEATYRLLRDAHTAVQCCLGDWLIYGEMRWRETYMQVADETGYEKDYLYNLASVCRRFTIEERRKLLERSEILRFSHLRSVAGMTAWLPVRCKQRQLALLRLARIYGLPVTALAEIKARLWARYYPTLPYSPENARDPKAALARQEELLKQEIFTPEEVRALVSFNAIDPDDPRVQAILGPDGAAKVWAKSSQPRRAQKRDANEGDIVRALIAAGAYITKIDGAGVADLMVGFKRQTFLIEVKDGANKLTDDQRQWQTQWKQYGGPLETVRTPEEALAFIGATEELERRAQAKMADTKARCDEVVQERIASRVAAAKTQIAAEGATV